MCVCVCDTVLEACFNGSLNLLLSTNDMAVGVLL